MKSFDGGHLTRTHKAAGPSVESLGMDCQMPFNRFLAFGSYVFAILVLYRVYFSTCSLLFFVWVQPIWRRSGFKKLDSKTIGCSIQSFFLDQWAKQAFPLYYLPLLNVTWSVLEFL